MPRVPKPVLWWSSGDDGTGLVHSVLTNKRVWLNGSNVRQHTPFQIRRRNLLARIPWLDRRMFGAWVADVPTMNLGSGNMRSATYWHAANVFHKPGNVDYFFIDGNGGVSGALAVSNTPTFHWRVAKFGGAGVKPKLDVDLTPDGLTTLSTRAELLHFGREYEVTYEGVVLAPQDPNVEIEIMEPGTSRDLLLETALDILSNELQDAPYNRHDQYMTTALQHVDSFLGRRYVDFALEGETVFAAFPGAPTPVSLTMKGDGPTRLLFAIRVHDRDNRTSSLSEFMPVVIPEPRLS